MTGRSSILVAAALLVAATVLHVLHAIVFRQARDTVFYMTLDIAFLPLNVLFVTLVLDQVLTARERKERQRKLNMVIGAFFSSTGYDLLRQLAPMAEEREDIAEHLALDLTWDGSRIRRAVAWCQGRTFTMRPESAALVELRQFLLEQRPFLLNMLENPLLLEHEVFTEVLWAVSHLGEELIARQNVTNLPSADLRHLAGDLERAYTRLQVQWLHYMIHLRQDYPYLYSFAARTNPLRPGARVEIEE